MVIIINKFSSVGVFPDNLILLGELPVGSIGVIRVMIGIDVDEDELRRAAIQCEDG